MDMLLIPLVLLVAAATAVVLLKRFLGESAGSAPPFFPYQAATFLSPAERSFLGALEQSVEGRFRVFAKVRLADVVRVRGGLSRSQRTSAFNRISRKHVDFVLCSFGDASVKAVIELDDKSHALPDRRDRDSFVDRALGAAGIECFHVPAASAYSVHQLRRMLEPVLAGNPAAQSVTADLRSADLPSEETAEPVGQPLDEQVNALTNAKSLEQACPKCGSALIERMAKRGARKGERFIACSAFPACRYTGAI